MIIDIRDTSDIMTSLYVEEDGMAVLSGESDAITDSSARTIASWYQSPGSVGSVFAQLASTGQAPSVELYEDIEATRSWFLKFDSYHESALRDMGQFEGWLDQKVADAHSETMMHVSYPHHPGRLMGCPACELRCHCAEGEAECVYEGSHSDS